MKPSAACRLPYRKGGDSLAAMAENGIMKWLRWWADEIGAMLAPVRNGRGDVIVGCDDRGVLELRLPDGGRQLIAPDAPLPDDMLKGRRIVLRLRPGQALAVDMRLPAAAAADPYAAVAFELPRVSPFSPEDVRFYIDDMRRSETGEQLEVTVRLVTKDRLDNCLQRLAQRGILPDLADFADADAPGDARRNFLEKGRGMALSRPLAVAAVLALVAALLSPLLYDYLQLRRIEAERLRFSADAEAARDLSRQLAGGGGAAADAQAFFARYPYISPVIERLSVALPDDAWLSLFEFSDGEIRIEGSAASAAALIGPLQDALPGAAVRFQAPVYRDALSGREKFAFAIALPTAARGAERLPEDRE